MILSIHKNNLHNKGLCIEHRHIKKSSCKLIVQKKSLLEFWKPQKFGYHKKWLKLLNVLFSMFWMAKKKKVGLDIFFCCWDFFLLFLLYLFVFRKLKILFNLCFVFFFFYCWISRNFCKAFIWLMFWIYLESLQVIYI